MLKRSEEAHQYETIRYIKLNRPQTNAWIDYEYDVVELDKKTKKLRRYKTILVSEKDVDEAFVKSYEKYYEVVDTNKLEIVPLTKLEEEVEE
jgi:hypothetical protein